MNFCFQDFGGSTLIFLLAVALAVAVLLMRSHRYLARQRREDADTSPPGGRLQRGPARGGSYTAAPPEVANWEVHMHETARDLMGQLDSKMRALQALTAEADRAAARLEAALDKSNESHREGAFSGRRQAGQAEGLAPAPSPPSTPPSQPPAAPQPPLQPAASRHEEIYTLSDYGYDAAEIARRLGLPVGEVELALRLRERRKAP